MGESMARLVHCKAALLLQTDVRQSATRAGIWRAQQCLQVGGPARVESYAALVLKTCRRHRFEPSKCTLREWERLVPKDMLPLKCKQRPCHGSEPSRCQPLCRSGSGCARWA